MNVFLLGNGFDLHHYLPTKYINFLNTVDILVNEYEREKFKNIGEVFGSSRIIQKDDWVKQCYEKHESVYNSIKLDESSIQEIIKLAHNNEWYKYMLAQFQKNANWIDFEKEIGFVCQLFKEYFDKCKKTVIAVPRNMETTLGFFLTIFEKKIETSQIYEINSFKYTIKDSMTIIDSNSKRSLNKSLIIEKLYESLRDLAKMLALYMKVFVDDTINYLLNNDLIMRNEVFSGIDCVFTLNYTNTYSKVYGLDSAKILHIHGDIDSDIVLGVQTDEDDEKPEINTDFICFKKYFQCSVFKTEFLLNTKIFELKRLEDEINLSVMGHSLDITDKDIIKKLFEIADKIVIYYHGDKVAHGDCVKKLVHIFGQQKYNEIATNTKLNYLHI